MGLLRLPWSEQTWTHSVRRPGITLTIPELPIIYMTPVLPGNGLNSSFRAALNRDSISYSIGVWPFQVDIRGRAWFVKHVGLSSKLGHETPSGRNHKTYRSKGRPMKNPLRGKDYFRKKSIMPLRDAHYLICFVCAEGRGKHASILRFKRNEAYGKEVSAWP